MPPPEWARIGNGQTFQALVGDLLKHRDHTIRVFNRPGRDLAIDMLSADGTAVYQAKFVGTRRFSDLKPKLLEELKRIEDLRGRDRWKPVIRWVVVSNVFMNESDETGWQQVAARARELGLNSELVWSDTLDSWLSDFPAVRQVFFDDINRCFTTPEEVETRLSHREGQGLGWQVDFVGRKPELAAAQRFLEAEDALVLTITGAPGSGRTRLLREVGRLQAELARPRDVLWGLSKALAESDQWTKALVRARPTLVLLDDPSPELVQRFFEQVENHLESWRLVVTQLSGAPPALDLQIRRSGLVHEIGPLMPLSEDEATALARSLLPKAERLLDEPNLAKLVRSSGHLPFWIVEIVAALDADNPRLLESLELVAFAAFDKMLRSVWPEETDRTKGKRLLQWCSLYEPLAPDEREIVDFIAGKIGISAAEARWMLERLLESGGGFGTRRVRLKPLPLRAALTTSLLASQETRSELAQDLLASAPGASTSPVPQPNRLAASLALAEPSKVGPLVAQVFGQLAKLAESERRPSVKLRLLERGRAFAGAGPEKFVDLVAVLRKAPTDSETEEIPYVGTRTRTHSDVIKALPWPLFEVAGALSTKDDQRRLLSELLAIADEELSLMLGDDRFGKSVSSVLSRILRGEASFSRDYLPIAEELASAALASLVEPGALDQLHDNRLRLLVSPQLAVEQRYSWSTSRTYHFSVGAFHPHSEEGEVRRRLMDQMWGLLESSLDSTKRESVLSLLADGIRSAGTAHGLPGGSHWSDDFLADLRRTRDYFNQTARPLSELSAMREAWSRCLLIDDTGDERRTIAETLEGLFQDATGLKWLLSPPSLRILESGKLLEEEASRRLRTPEELRDFIRRIRNLPKHEEWRWRSAAFAVGRLIADGADLSDLLRAAFQSQEKIERDFAGDAFVLWVEHVRRDRPLALRTVLEDLVGNLDGDSQLRLLKRLYALNFGPKAVSGDADFLLSRLDLVAGLGPWERFSTLGKITLLHWDQVTKIVEQMSAGIKPEDTAHAWTGLVDGVWVSSVSLERPLEEHQWEWLIEQCQWVSDLDALGDMALYHARELKPKSHAGMSLDWVTDFLEYRAVRFGSGPGVKGLPIQDDIWTLVARPTVASRQSDQAALARLFTRYSENQAVDWGISRLVSRLDPTGIVAPELIAERLGQLPPGSLELKDVLKWSSFAGHYEEGSEAWEKIAGPACEIARRFSGDDQNSVLWSLRWSEPVIETRRPGKPSGRWDSEIEIAERNLQKLEPSNPIRSFWEWKKRYCQAWRDDEAKRIEEGEE